ncbi:hypothetical protein [Burkholderia multivorans]|uniref:hypothetical protein n=1 Tax=Burkholderia multivorans TaxID=87883 RepID=UPI0021C0EBBD|nr:hypothetical protein [Burkholderia multivorans]
MTTLMIHDKIPHNQRVPRNKAKAARDAVTPSVRGITGITPSVRGIALRKITGSGPVADALRKATKIAVGLDALVTAQKLAAETGDAELAALVNSPKLVKAVDRAIKRLGRDVDLFTNRPTEGDPNVTAGLIGDSRGQWHAMDHHTRLEMEQRAYARGGSPRTGAGSCCCARRCVARVGSTGARLGRTGNAEARPGESKGSPAFLLGVRPLCPDISIIAAAIDRPARRRSSRAGGAFTQCPFGWHRPASVLRRNASTPVRAATA